MAESAAWQRTLEVLQSWPSRRQVRRTSAQSERGARRRLQPPDPHVPHTARHPKHHSRARRSPRRGRVAGSSTALRPPLTTQTCQLVPQCRMRLSRPLSSKSSVAARVDPLLRNDSLGTLHQSRHLAMDGRVGPTATDYGGCTTNGFPGARFDEHRRSRHRALRGCRLCHSCHPLSALVCQRGEA